MFLKDWREEETQMSVNDTDSIVDIQWDFFLPKKYILNKYGKLCSLEK